MSDLKSWCCESDCDKDAEFAIWDLADARDTGYTESCCDHVGALLSHDPRLTNAIDCWEVIAL